MALPGRRLRLAWLLLLALPTLLHGQAAPERLTLAAYNVEWLTDVFDDPYTQDETAPPKPRAKLEQVAKAVRSLNPDVLGLVELENEGVLKAFVAEMLADMGYQYVAAQPTNSDRGQNLGILSRVPVESITSHRLAPLVSGPPRTPPTSMPAASGATPGAAPTTQPAPPQRFARDLMQVRLRLSPRRSLDVFLVHLKSKHDGPGDPKSAKWRLAEAQTAREIIGRHLQSDPQAWVVLMGDFNDTPDSATHRALLAPYGSAPALVDLHAGLAPAQRRSYLKPPYDQEGPVDYILASAGLARRVVAGSARVLSDREVLGGSDHAPVAVTLDLREQPERPRP